VRSGGGKQRGEEEEEGEEGEGVTYAAVTAWRGEPERLGWHL
jgi:hypothetical protein